MLTERETEHERLAVFGVVKWVYVCVCVKREVGVRGWDGADGTNVKGEGGNQGPICTSSAPN